MKKEKVTNQEKDVDYDVMATFLKVFGDNTRLRILSALNNNEHTVTELCTLLNMTKSAISHQLRILKDNRLVKLRKVGKNVYFSLCDDHVSMILETTKKHLKEK